MKIEIKSRWSAKILFSIEAASIRLAVEAAVQSGANLREANLREANLREANLRGADLREADLREADLREADLCGANLRGADLCEANLRGANLCEADLCGANLRGADLCEADLCEADLCGASLCGANLCEANLRGANLCGASLCGANLCEADLRGANLCGASLCEADLREANLCEADLTPVRDDLWAVLCSAPREVAGLRQALVDGRVDGSTYTGECACLVGTIANVRHCEYTDLPVLAPNSDRPAERFFLGIKKGDTPETNQFSKLAVEWIDQWQANINTLVGTTA